MDPFDPAINYGPNDAGVSAITIILIIVGLTIGSWGIGTLYGLIKDLLTKKERNTDQN